jgi:hypothetical protein
MADELRWDHAFGEGNAVSEPQPSAVDDANGPVRCDARATLAFRQ